tara:strand:- start:1277 stop:1447 length:171 start_codon:yes stop_codon:yes gene_type:complete
MFGLFKRKTEKEKLQVKYESLMKEAFRLSKVNRTQSDQKYFEADQILKRIESNDKA